MINLRTNGLVALKHKQKVMERKENKNMAFMRQGSDAAADDKGTEQGDGGTSGGNPKSSKRSKQNAEPINTGKPKDYEGIDMDEKKET